MAVLGVLRARAGCQAAARAVAADIPEALLAAATCYGLGSRFKLKDIRPAAAEPTAIFYTDDGINAMQTPWGVGTDPLLTNVTLTEQPIVPIRLLDWPCAARTTFL